MWQEFGLGQPEEYWGTAEQNIRLLRAMRERDVAEDVEGVAPDDRPEYPGDEELVDETPDEMTASFLEEQQEILEQMRAQQEARAEDVPRPEEIKTEEEARLDRDIGHLRERYAIAGEEAKWVYERGLEQVERARSLIPGMFAVPREAIDDMTESVFDLHREYNHTLRDLTAQEQEAVAARQDQAADRMRQAKLDYHDTMEHIMSRTLDLMDYQYKLHRIPIDEEKQRQADLMNIAMEFPHADIDIDEDDIQTATEKAREWTRDYPQEEVMTINNADGSQTLYRYNSLTHEMTPFFTTEAPPDKPISDAERRKREATRGRITMSHRMTGPQPGDLVEKPQGQYQKVLAVDGDGNVVSHVTLLRVSPEAQQAIDEGAVVWPEGESLKPLIDPKTQTISSDDYLRARMEWMNMGLNPRDFDDAYSAYLPAEETDMGDSLERAIDDVYDVLERAGGTPGIGKDKSWWERLKDWGAG